MPFPPRGHSPCATHVLLARLSSCVDVLTSDTLPPSGEPDIALAIASVRNRALRAIRVDAPGSPEIR
jgi:hypothetical protein